MTDHPAPHDEEDDTCQGCGALVDDEYSWCPECAPELY
jgi:RNA polymerase subunit RPABC4/transcription elongation factor Spt4